MKIPAYFAPHYAPGDIPSLARLAVAAHKFERLGLVELRQPPAFDAGLLEGLHDPRYLDAFLNGHEPLASGQGLPWSPALRDATLAMLGGQVAGARDAWRNGIAMNIARGFHHAVYERGTGFCPINGLALIAKLYPERRIMVIDCDEHGGNGTEEFTARLPNLYNVSIFGTRFGCRGGERSWPFQVRVRKQGFQPYLDALAEARMLATQVQPDLLIYQAGVDCHENDPKSQAALSRSQLFHRDRVVFTLARQLDIPILFVVAGGYQAAEEIARLNANTVRAARWVWRNVPAGSDQSAAERPTL